MTNKIKATGKIVVWPHLQKDGSIALHSTWWDPEDSWNVRHFGICLMKATEGIEVEVEAEFEETDGIALLREATDKRIKKTRAESEQKIEELKTEFQSWLALEVEQGE